MRHLFLTISAILWQFEIIETKVMAWKDFYITSPYERVSWVAGKSAKITWDEIPGGGGPVDSISLALMDGPDNNAKTLMKIVDDLDPSSTSYLWEVPTTFPNTDQVFVRITGVNSENKSSIPVVRYSHRFTVINKDYVSNQKTEIPVVKTTSVPAILSTKIVSVVPVSTVTKTVESSTSIKEQIVIASSAGSNSENIIKITSWILCGLVLILYII